MSDFRYLNWSQSVSCLFFLANRQFFSSWPYTWSIRLQRCWVIVGNLLGWPNNIRVQVYFGLTAVAAIWDYTAESPVWKQVNGREGDFRGAVFRTGRRDGPAGRRRPRTGVVKCLAKVLSGPYLRCHNDTECCWCYSVLCYIHFRLMRNEKTQIQVCCKIWTKRGFAFAETKHQVEWMAFGSNIKGNSWIIVVPSVIMWDDVVLSWYNLKRKIMRLWWFDNGQTPVLILCTVEVL